MAPIQKTIFCRSLARTAWWAIVTVAPEVSRISVFRNGRPQVWKGVMPSGGQTSWAALLIAGTLALK